MKIAFSKPTRDPAAQRLLFDRYQDFGYDGLQLKGGQYSAHLHNPHTFQQGWGTDPAHVSSLITMNPLDEEGVSRFQQLLGFAAAVGAERIVICHDVPRDGLTDTDLAAFARLFSGLGREAAARGVRLSLHHHTNQPVMHRHDFDVFFRAVEEDTVSLTVDTGHLMRSGVTDIAGLIRDLAPFIDNIHLKDVADTEFQLLGRGQIDFDPIFAALNAINFSDTICVDEESTAGILEGMKVSHEFLAPRLAGRTGT